MAGGGEGPPEPAAATDREPACVAIAALGFPIVFLTLIAHGLGIFFVRQGYWMPSPAADALWTGIVVFGLVAGIAVSAWPAKGLR